MYYSRSIAVAICLSLLGGVFLSMDTRAQVCRKKLQLDTLLQSSIIQNPSTEIEEKTAQWTAISASEFRKYAGSGQINPEVSLKKVTISDTLIVVHAGQKDVRFPLTSLIYYGYTGYLKYPGIHILDCSSASAGIAYQIIVDEKTGYHFPISSPFDSGSSGPILSPDKKQLLFYSNDVFDPNSSMISIHNIACKGREYTIEPLFTQTMNFHITEISWMDEHHVAVHAITMKEQNEDQSSSEEIETDEFLMCTWK